MTKQDDGHPQSRKAAARTACTRDRLLDLAVGTIASRGWCGFRLEHLAAEAGCPVAELRRWFATRYDLLVALAERADAAMFEAARQIRPDDPPQDRLHAVLMARFEASAGDRAALKRLLEATIGDPLLAAVHLRNLHAWARRALTLAGMAAERPLAVLVQEKILATAVILPVLPRWIADESTDLAATEAALDRAIARILPVLTGGRPPTGEAAGMQEASAEETAAPASPVTEQGA